jgi:eukaryotic-like serine/threonine-protein kinase
VREGTVLVGKYRVERVIGQGGMGVVVAARHEQLDDRVAIKLMLPAIAENPEAVARFVREARAAAKIKSEHVARVSDVGTLETGEPYMVMEYLEGADLSALLQQHGRLSLEVAADYLLQACEAIAQAHELGIVHRDLKPANLYVINRRDGYPLVKVLDFGISKITTAAVDSSMTRTSALMGSPLYMSPEQMNSARDVDRRTDVWSLGVILYELLTGQPPFNGETLPQVCAQILTGPTPNVRERNPALSEAIQAVVARCLERDPSRRFPNVEELAAALAPFAPMGAWKRTSKLGSTGDGRAVQAVLSGGLPVPGAGTNAAWGETAPPVPVRRFPWLLVAGVAVVIVGGAGAALALRASPNPPPADLPSAAAPNAPTAVVTPTTATAEPTPTAPTAAAPIVAPTPAASPSSHPVAAPPAAPTVTVAKPPASPPVAAAGVGAKFRPTGAAIGTPGRPLGTTAATLGRPPTGIEKPPPPKEPPATGSKTPSTGSLGGRL